MFNILKRLINKPDSEPKVKFYSLSPLLTVDSPIIPASDLKRDWVSLQGMNFQHRQTIGSEQKNHLMRSSHRCPALVDIFSRGYIITAHRDYYFHTRGDINRPEYEVFPATVASERHIQGRVGPFGVLGQMGGDPEPFMGDQLLGIKRPYPERTPNILFKLIVPWLVSAPVDTSLLYMGVPLANTQDFSVVSGIQDTQLSGAISILLWWHHHGRKDIFLKKGTPLLQIVPVPKAVTNMGYTMVTDPKEVEEQIVRRKNLQHMLDSQFVVDYDRSKSIAGQYLANDVVGNKTSSSKCPFSFLWSQ